MRLSRFFFALCLLPFTVAGQFSPLRQAEKKMTQGDWAEARQILAKALRKDSLNVQAELVMCRWFLHAQNPSRQIDSAYRHNLKALHDFRKSSLKQKEKLKKENTDSSVIVRIRVTIDSLGFERAKQINSEQSYQDFLNAFLFAQERTGAIELRDEVAYVNVLRQNSYQAFADYLRRYPESHRANDARERHEKLLFEFRTRDKKLSSFVAFAREFPSSRYKPVADKNIFELSTAAGTPDAFLKFIDHHPTSTYLNLARNILFHIARESEEHISLTWMTDSLKKVVDISKLDWFPIYKNGKFGFMDSRGVERFAPQFDAVLEEYKCGPIKDNVLVTANGLFSRGGTRLMDRTSLVKDLGYGFLKVGDTSCVKVLHKSGAYVIDECLQDASLLNGRFILVKKNGLIGLAALSGRLILPPQWSSIEMIEGMMVLDRVGKKTLCLASQLELVADDNPVPENFVFDNIKSLGNGRLLVTNGALEGMMDLSMRFVSPLERQSLTQTNFGLVRKIDDRFLFDLPLIDKTTWQHYRFYRQWLLLENETGLQLYDVHTKKIVESKPDSLWVTNGLVFASGRDSVHVHVNSSTRITLGRTSQITFIKSADSIQYFLTEQKNKKTVFRIETGQKLFVTDVDQIESLGKDAFIVARKNKRGLLNRMGKLLLPLEYDAIVPSKGQLSLLKERKFGLYDPPSGRLIKPAFERNIASLDRETLIAYKDGHYGLIDWTAKPLSLFEFDEVREWRQQLIWVKKGFEWTLFDFGNAQDVVRHVKRFYLILDRRDEKIAIVQQENFFGVLSSTRGMIIPTSFTFIRNLGSEDDPLYFTAKEVEEADIFVVIYYDREGKLLRKQVYEEEEYAHILCPED